MPCPRVLSEGTAELCPVCGQRVSLRPDTSFRAEPRSRWCVEFRHPHSRPAARLRFVSHTEFLQNLREEVFFFFYLLKKKSSQTKCAVGRAVGVSWDSPGPLHSGQEAWCWVHHLSGLS